MASHEEYRIRKLWTRSCTESRIWHKRDWRTHRLQNGGKCGLDGTGSPEWGKTWSRLHMGSGMEENTDRIAHGVQNWEFTEWMT